MVKEVICINIGQAGVQMANAAWELFCMEHGIEANGLLKDGQEANDDESFRTFFQEVPTGQFVPRTISIDLEPTVIDEVRTGVYRHLFHPDQLISSMEDGASNFARGFFTIGKRQIENLTNTARKLVDACEGLQGFFIIHSVSGGTGSGFTTLILDTLTLEYTKRNKFQMSIFPSPLLCTAIVEPYNTMLSSVRSLEISDIANFMDNEAVYSICNSSLNIPCPNYTSINRIISQVFSDMTTSLRFQSSLNSDLDQLCTNLIPYPRIHFPIVCHAPLISVNKAEHEPINTIQLTKNLFEKSNQMVSCSLKDGKYMCCVIQYRGRITPKEVNQAIFDIKRKNEIKFVDWCPTGFKLGVNNQPPIRVPSSDIAQSDRSVTMLANSTSIRDVWKKVMLKFDILFSKRSFVHWYVGEGMEEGEFNEARDEVDGIYLDYMELEGFDEEDKEKDQKEEKKTDEEVTGQQSEKELSRQHSSEKGKKSSNSDEVEAVEEEEEEKKNTQTSDEDEEDKEEEEEKEKEEKEKESEEEGESEAEK